RDHHQPAHHQQDAEHRRQVAGGSAHGDHGPSTWSGTGASTIGVRSENRSSPLDRACSTVYWCTGGTTVAGAGVVGSGSPRDASSSATRPAEKVPASASRAP